MMCELNQKAVILILLFLQISCGANLGQKNWPNPGVDADKIGITKTPIVTECCFRGLVRSMQLGKFDDSGKLKLAVVPQTGIFLFDPITFKKTAQLDFSNTDGSVRWFGISSYLIQHKNGFSIAMLGGGYGDVGLLDESGTPLWVFKPDPKLPPNGMVVDDAIEGEPRFFVCDRGALYRLDASGTVLWKVDENADYIELVPSQDRDEASFATASHNSQVLKIWSAEGKPIQQIELPFAPNGLAFVRSGTTSGFVVMLGAQYGFINENGNLSFIYSNVGAPIYHGPNAKLVRLVINQPPVLAISSTSSSAIGKSVLTVLSLDGTQLYQEYLGAGATLAVVPTQNETRDRLLVAEGKDKIWIYEKLPDNQSEP